MSFSDGLFRATVRGGLIAPVQLDAGIRKSIAICLEKEKSLTCELETERFERFMAAANWLEHKLDNNVVLFQPINKDIANELLDFCNRNKCEFPEAMQWILNHVNKRYSLFELMGRHQP